MKILVPTDFSKNAEHAIVYAMNLAKALKARVTLYNFVSIPIYSSDSPIAIPSESELKSSSEEVLIKKRNQLAASFPDVKIDIEVEASINFPEDAIIKEESGCRADLVVMGTHGSAGGVSKLVGSNTLTVIENSCCPVIAVPQEAAIAIPKKVAFAINYGEKDFDNLIRLIELTRKTNSAITIFHLRNSKEDIAHADAEIEGLLQRVRETTGEQEIHVKILDSDHHLESLNQFLTEGKFDMLCVSTRKRSFLDRLFEKSMTRKMLYHTHLPLMAFSG